MIRRRYVAVRESNWGAVIGDAQKMTKEESDSENVYTITLDLSEGDQFQFAMDSSWGDQRGYGISIRLNRTAWIILKNSGLRRHRREAPRIAARWREIIRLH